MSNFALSHLKSLLYREPKAQMQRLMRWGPRAYFCCDHWAKAMERAAWTLPQLPASDNFVELWFLTGSRFWFQTAFCAWSFARQSNCQVVLNLVDDGTLDEHFEGALRRIFPLGKTLRKRDVQERVEEYLPVERFPFLRRRWGDYINIRKLTDIHLGSSGPKLVLDSDMLFFRRPAILHEWREGRCGSTLLHMTDCIESYGYSRPLLEKLAGGPLPQKLNVGICGMESGWLDWNEIEYWCRTLIESEGGSYYLEQALVAMLAVRHPRTCAAAGGYITFPNPEQTKNSAGVLQHYVADSKPAYFRYAWRNALANAR